MCVAGRTVMCVEGFAIVVWGVAAAGGAENASAAPARSAHLIKIFTGLVEQSDSPYVYAFLYVVFGPYVSLGC